MRHRSGFPGRLRFPTHGENAEEIPDSADCHRHRSRGGSNLRLFDLDCFIAGQRLAREIRRRRFT